MVVLVTRPQHPPRQLTEAHHSLWEVGREMEQIRRRLPRQFTDWRGRYLVEGDCDERWRGCRVIDISTAGAGLELLETSTEEISGRRILLAVLLRGELRNVGPGKNDGLRVGIQFTDLTKPERTYLDSLTEIHALW
jgi:hypothetical protein